MPRRTRSSIISLRDFSMIQYIDILFFRVFPRYPFYKEKRKYIIFMDTYAHFWSNLSNRNRRVDGTLVWPAFRWTPEIDFKLNIFPTLRLVSSSLLRRRRGLCHRGHTTNCVLHWNEFDNSLSRGFSSKNSQNFCNVAVADIRRYNFFGNCIAKPRVLCPAVSTLSVHTRAHAAVAEEDEDEDEDEKAGAEGGERGRPALVIHTCIVRAMARKSWLAARHPREEGCSHASYVN